MGSRVYQWASRQAARGVAVMIGITPLQGRTDGLCARSQSAHSLDPTRFSMIHEAPRFVKLLSR